MSEPGASDEALIGRYASGEVAAFEVLYRRHEMAVWRYLERNVGDRATAEELMQEVWFAVARDAAHYQPTARFASWLFAIARHRMIDALRARRGHLSLEALGYEAQPVARQLSTEPSVGPLATVMVLEQASALARAVRALPGEQRDAFLLHVEGGLSVEEVAAVTRSSFEATRSRLRYARSKLRELLSEHA
jgi:RNA polymerase sigma factor (sigma-70 family)